MSTHWRALCFTTLVLFLTPQVNNLSDCANTRCKWHCIKDTVILKSHTDLYFVWEDQKISIIQSNCGCIFHGCTYRSSCLADNYSNGLCSLGSLGPFLSLPPSFTPSAWLIKMYILKLTICTYWWDHLVLEVFSTVRSCYILGYYSAPYVSDIPAIP